MGNGIHIRPYESRDREAVRYIAVATALAGEPADKFLDADHLLADALTSYFTDYEPESCFVADREGKVVGYIIGSVDTRVMDRVVLRQIVAGLFWSVIKTGFLLRKKNLIFLWNSLVAFMQGEFAAPDFTGEFPATLHINLLPEARGCGSGSVLMSTYLAYLIKRRVKGVRMATISSEAGEFFKKQGFRLLFQGYRSYLRHVIGKNLPLYIWGQQFSYDVR